MLSSSSDLLASPASPPLRRTLGVSRRREAQPGNINALKHGFYARNLPLNDTAGLDDLPLDALADEITLLRILIRRVNPGFTLRRFRRFAHPKGCYHPRFLGTFARFS